MLLVAIAGGTSSGKTALAQKLRASLPEGSVNLLSEDSYFKDRSSLPPGARAVLNFDHPDALDSTLMHAHLVQLCEGRPVDVPDYDFVTHCRRAATIAMWPRPITLVEGRLILREVALRSLFRLKIYVDVAADIRLLRRLRRDVAERGRDIAQIEKQYLESVRDMHDAHVEPTKAYADLIVPSGADNEIVLELLLCHLRRFLRVE